MKPSRLLAGGAAALALLSFGATTTASAATCPTTRWVTSWAAAPSDGSGSFSNGTIRMIIKPHAGGSKLKIRLSNRYGTGNLTISKVTIGKQLGTGASLKSRWPSPNAVPVTFGGQSSPTIATGQDLLSDETTLPFDSFEPLAIDVFISGSVPKATRHKSALQTSYLTPSGTGDRAGVTSGSSFTEETTSWYLLSGLEVQKPGDWGTVVTFGDSISDGTGSDAVLPVPDNAGWFAPKYTTDVRYPDWLQRRLTADGRKLSVAGAGIAGNRLLSPGTLEYAGAEGLTRLDADALKQAGVTDVILFEGGNDMGQYDSDLNRFPRATDIIDGLKQATQVFHQAGLNVVLMTMMPTGGALVPTYGETWMGDDRRALNAWIRANANPHTAPALTGPATLASSYDPIANGYFDLNATVRDAGDVRMLEQYTTIDNVHPNGFAYRDFIDDTRAAGRFSLLKGPQCG